MWLLSQYSIIMARPTTIRDEQILQAARAVFLEKGISATTAEVARRAGIAEGSIFHRYKSKPALFQAAMQLDTLDPPWLRLLVAKVGYGDLRETLVDVGLAAIDFFRTLMPLMMMSWSNPETAGAWPEGLSGPQPLPVRAIRRIASVFEAEMRAGRLRRHDPEILARAFVGGLVHYVFFELMAKNASDELPLPAETFVRGLVHLYWNGAAPVEPTPRQKKKPKKRAR